MKVTDYKTKEMVLLTSQIFDIKSDEMQESKTSGFAPTRRRSRALNEVSQSMQLPGKAVSSLQQSEKSTSRRDLTVNVSQTNSKQKLPWLNAQSRFENSKMRSRQS